MVNKKETVLHLLNSSSFSGAENVVCQIIENTDKNTKTVYCSPDGKIRKVLEQKNIAFEPLAQLSYSELKRLIKKYKPTVIHAHDFRASLLASLFYRQARIISHIHQNPEWLNSNGLKSRIYKLCTSRYDRIVIVADAIKGSLVFKSIPDNKVVVLKNFVDETSIAERAKQERVASYDIVFCGRLEDVKQPFDFIKTVKLITKEKPTVKAVMLGDGVLMDDCKKLIEELGLQENIKMPGFESNPFPFMKKGRFLMLTSQFEGFGLVALEAVLLDTAVLSYDIPAIREMIGTNEAFASSPRELADVFLQFDSDALKYNSLKKHQRRNVSTLTIPLSAWRESIHRIYDFKEPR